MAAEDDMSFEHMWEHGKPGHEVGGLLGSYPKFDVCNPSHKQARVSFNEELQYDSEGRYGDFELRRKLLWDCVVDAFNNTSKEAKDIGWDRSTRLSMNGQVQPMFSPTNFIANKPLDASPFEVVWTRTALPTFNAGDPVHWETRNR